MFSREKIPAYAIGFITLSLIGLGVGALVSTPPEQRARFHQGPVYEPSLSQTAVPTPSWTRTPVAPTETPPTSSEAGQTPSGPATRPTPSRPTEAKPRPSNSPRAITITKPAKPTKPQPHTGGRGSGQPGPQTVTGQPSYVSPPPSDIPITPTETNEASPEPTGSEL